MEAFRIGFVAVVVVGLALLIWRVSTLNSARAGFAIVARYPTRREAEEACDFLRHHGLRAELEERWARVRIFDVTGSVIVLVPTAQIERAKRAFKAMADTTKRH